MVTREYPPFIVGGVATHTYQLVKYLRKFGIDVVVLSFGDPKLSTDNEIFIEPQSSVIEEARGGTKLYKDLLLVKDIEKITSYARKLLLESKFDIVHVQEPYIGGLITFNRKVTTIHDTGIGEIKSILEYSNLGNPQVTKKLLFYSTLGYFMEYASILSSKVIISPSYTCKRELIYMYKVKPEKIFVVHNGIEPPSNIPGKEEARKILGLPKDKVIVFTIGRHIPRKRFDLLIEAVKKLDKNLRENLLVLIGGKGPETKTLRLLIEKYSLSDSVRLVGYIPDNMIWIYYSASDIFVITSVEESAPMVLLEAASMGNAIVTSRTGDYALMMKNGVDGLVFEPGDVNALTRILEELVINENLRHALSRNAKLFASKFTAEKMAWKTLRVYEKLVKGQV
jgi:Glycosyltransferase